MLIADPQLGVVADARRRQRRRRGLFAAALAALAAVVAWLVVPPALHTARLAPSSSLRYLTGPSLGRTGLRLIALENTGRPYLVDVDHGTAVPVTGMLLPAPVAPNGTTVYPLVAHGAGALAFVTLRACARCGATVAEYLIGADGHAQRLWTRAFGYHQTFLPAAGSTAVWVSTWPHAAPCWLALEPGSRGSVRVPCGALEAVTATGALIGNGNVLMLVDPLTGRVRLRARLPPAGAVSLRGTLALESSPDPRSLALVDLASGARRTLRWPSTLHFGYQAIPAPSGPLVALRFGQPWYPPSQAVDVWVLDTRSGRLTHVPGYPALELLKFSSVAWTPDGRLVVASRRPRRTSTARAPGSPERA